MRYLALVAVLSLGLLAWLLTWGRVGEPAVLPTLLALAAPPSVVANERVTVYGGVSVPEGRYELGMYACQAGRCSRSLWLAVDGPRELWRSFGSVAFELPDEPATLELRMFRADGVADAVVAEWSQTVTVLPAPQEVE